MPVKHSSVVRINPKVDGFKKQPNETKAAAFWSMGRNFNAFLVRLGLRKLLKGIQGLFSVVHFTTLPLTRH